MVSKVRIGRTDREKDPETEQKQTDCNIERSIGSMQIQMDPTCWKNSDRNKHRDQSEDNRWTVLKIQHSMRKHIKKALGLDRQEERGRVSTRRNLKAIRRAVQKKAQESRQSRARKLIDLLERHKEMLELGYESGNLENQNKLNEIVLRLLSVAQEQGIDWCQEIFKGTDLSAIRAFGRRAPEERERETEVEWIRDRLSREPVPQASKQETITPRENYEKDVGK